MGTFDHLIPGKGKTDEAPAKSSGTFSHLIPNTVPEGPPAPARTREQQERLKVLNKLMVKDPDKLDLAADEYTLGMARPLSGIKNVVEGKASELFGTGTPATVGEYYRGGVKGQEDYFDRAAEYNPGPGGTAASLVGGVGSGIGTSGGRMLTKGAQALNAFTQGAVGGASRNATDPGSAAGGAVIGGAVDATVSSTVRALADRFLLRGARKDISVASREGSSQGLRTEGGAIFDRLDQAGIHYNARQTTPFVGDVVQRLSDAGFNPNMHRSLIPVLGEIGQTSGVGATWRQLQQMREQIGKLKVQNNPGLRNIAGEIGDELDNFIRTARPTIPARSVAAGIINPAVDVEAARRLWARASKAEKIENLAEIGTARAANPTAVVEGNFDRYADSFKKNPDKYNPFGNNTEQLQLIDAIRTGEPAKEAMAKRLNWGAAGVGGAGGVGLAAAAGGPLTGFYESPDKSWLGSASALGTALALRGGANAFRRSAAENSSVLVNDLIRNIVNGRTAPSPNAVVPRNALAKIVAGQDVAQGAGNYASSFVDKKEQP
jgi:hypothetical protein